MVIVVDDEDRENEGDLTMAASKVTPTRSTSWRSTGAG
jgi:3,4-dihydroxy 2-butanone 4-phosphate synthase/GTP cyclohydrolase II